MERKWLIGFASVSILLGIAIVPVLAQDDYFTLTAKPSSIDILLPFEGDVLLSLVYINVTSYVTKPPWWFYWVELSWTWVGDPPGYGVFPMGPFPDWVWFDYCDYGESKISGLFILVLKSVPEGVFTLRVTGDSYYFGSSYVDITLSIHH